jgi:hypothetical protein
VRYFHTIVQHFHLGSITAITDETGAVVECMAYDAWGWSRKKIDAPACINPCATAERLQARRLHGGSPTAQPTPLIPS